jgi:hypothetical protein
MVEFSSAGVVAPIARELGDLYGKYIPDDDVLDIRIIIRKYFNEKYGDGEDLQITEIGAVREDFSEWAPDPGK